MTVDQISQEKIQGLLFGEWIREERITVRLKEKDLAEKVGIHPSYIHNIEKRGCVPRREIVIKLAKELNLFVDEALLRAGYSPEFPWKRILKFIQKCNLKEISDEKSEEKS